MTTPLRHFLSEDECRSLLRRLVGFARGGGITTVNIDTRWTQRLSWARNDVSAVEDTQTNKLFIRRLARHGGGIDVEITQFDDASLERAQRMAERLIALHNFSDSGGDIIDTVDENYVRPPIFSYTTYNLSINTLATITRDLMQSIKDSGLQSAGNIEISARGRAVMSSSGLVMYYPYTRAEYTLTVRDPKGLSSGWAGGDHFDWNRIDTTTITRRAVEKGIASRHPVAIEPGRYPVILEPQAVADFMIPFGDSRPTVFPWRNGQGRPIKIGERVIDERLSLSADPMDLELGIVPFGVNGETYQPVKWIENGILKERFYGRKYAVTELQQERGLYYPEGTRISVSSMPVSIEEMIANTQRGLLVTRFVNVMRQHDNKLSTGYTRDGLSLIERGKISKSVKNMKYEEAVISVLNQIESIGVPVRVYNPNHPTIVPALKIREFNFIALADAI
jgi:predicted Zn-dependent protease